MSTPLDSALSQAALLIGDISRISRVVLSGRRRNFSPKFERITIRPVKLKDEIKYQVVESDGRQDFTKNLNLADLKINEYLNAGYANILIEMVEGTYSLRITKKGEALIHRSSLDAAPQSLAHDREKSRLLPASDPLFIELGISDK